MTAHAQISDLFRDRVFFAHPRKPWQRPPNMDSNGLLRQYFPKSTGRRLHTAEDLRAGTGSTTRPRKTLQWQTPAQILTEPPRRCPTIASLPASS
jgi:transposase, IS30 family